MRECSAPTWQDRKPGLRCGAGQRLSLTLRKGWKPGKGLTQVGAAFLPRCSLEFDAITVSFKRRISAAKSSGWAFSLQQEMQWAGGGIQSSLFPSLSVCTLNVANLVSWRPACFILIRSLSQNHSAVQMHQCKYP